MPSPRPSDPSRARRRPAGRDLDEALRLRPEAVWGAVDPRLEARLARGATEGLLRDLDRRVARDPASGTYRALRADLKRRPEFGLYEEALEDLEHAAGLSPGCFWILGWWGRALAQAGRHEAALSVWGQAERLEPACSWILIEKASLFLLLDRAQEALRAAQEAARWDPEGARLALWGAWAALGRGRRVVAAWERLPEGPGKAAAAGLVSKILFENNDYLKSAAALKASARAGFEGLWPPQGERALNRLLKEQPGDPWFWVWRGALRAGEARFEEGEADFRGAIDADKRFAPAWIGRGVCRLRTGQAARALADFGRGLRLSEALPAPFRRRLQAEAFTGRGEAQRILGRLAPAEADFSAALRVDPTRAAAYLGRAEVCLRAGRDPGEDLRRALELDAQYGEAHLLFGVWRRRQGRLREALPALDRAAALRPSWALPLLHRALVWGRLGEPEAQIRDFEAALALDPAFFRARLPRLEPEARQVLRAHRLDAWLERFLGETPKRGPRRD